MRGAFAHACRGVDTAPLQKSTACATPCAGGGGGECEAQGIGAGPDNAGGKCSCGGGWIAEVRPPRIERILRQQVPAFKYTLRANTIMGSLYAVDLPALLCSSKDPIGYLIRAPRQVYVVECGAHWGWWFVGALLFGAALYLVGGAAYAHKVRGPA